MRLIPKKNLNFNQVQAAQIVNPVAPREMMQAGLAGDNLLQTNCDYQNSAFNSQYELGRVFKPVTSVLMDENNKPYLKQLIESNQDRSEYNKMLDAIKGVDSKLPEMPQWARLEAKAKLGKRETISYCRAIAQNADPIWGFTFGSMNINWDQIERKINVGELPSFKFGISNLFPDKKEYPDHVLGIVVKGPNDLVIRATNADKVPKEFPYSEDFFWLCTNNIINDRYRDMYFEMLEHCASKEINETLTKGPDVLFRTFKDSKKFTEWIVEQYSIGKPVVEEPDDDGKTTIRKSQRSTAAPDRYSPSKAEQQQNLAKAISRGSVDVHRRTYESPDEQSGFKTPADQSLMEIADLQADLTKLGLSPLGKQEVQEALSKDTARLLTKKEYKQDLIKMAKDEPSKYGKFVQEKKKGKAIRAIIIPPGVDERIKRLNVILGSRNAGNNTMYEEFTTILDSLLKDNVIDKAKYKYLLKKLSV